jgi:DNA-binding response OmpR family regulator
MSKIAWIEDDIDEISSLVRLLELDGYEIPRYRTRSDVDKYIEEILSCDAIILDIILPPIEEDPHQGLSILKILRERYHYNKPVVVCSVVRAPGVMDELRKFGVSNGNVLHKPVRPSVLTATVKKALGQE